MLGDIVEFTSLVELVGWIGAGLTFTAYSMKTMLPLRVIAVLANIFFGAYGYLTDVYPTMFLHMALLPMNSVRLYQILSLSGQIKRSRGSADAIQLLRPLMKTKKFKAGDHIFAKGDSADNLYVVEKGSVLLVELEKRLNKGELFGEIAFFLGSGKRTLSAVCDEDCEVLYMSEEGFIRQYYLNPAFSFFIVKVAVERLVEGMQSNAAAYRIENQSTPTLPG